MIIIWQLREGSKQLSSEIREKLMSRLNLDNNNNNVNLVPELYSLFREADDNGNGNLSRLEFEDLMHELDVHFSRKKWSQIFHEIDRNFDNSISFEEFFLFIFPDHTTAKVFIIFVLINFLMILTIC